MRKDVIVEVSVADRARLGAIVAERNRPQKHVRAIILRRGATSVVYRCGTAGAGDTDRGAARQLWISRAAAGRATT
jgi:hypothetical protein